MALKKPVLYKTVGNRQIPLVTPDSVISISIREEHRQKYPDVPVIPPFVDPPDPDADVPVEFVPIPIPPQIVHESALAWFQAEALNFDTDIVIDTAATYMDRDGWMSATSLSFATSNVELADTQGYGYTNRMMKLTAVDGVNQLYTVAVADKYVQRVAA